MRPRNLLGGRRKGEDRVKEMIGPWRAAPRRLAGLVRTAWPKRGLVAEACLALLIAETRLRMLPLKRQGVPGPVPPGGAAFDGQRPRAGPADRQAALEVGWAVTRVAAYFPTSAMCLAQALAARAMLRRRGIASLMHVGVARPEGAPFEAHAWLEAAGVEVTGYPVPPHLRQIACLPSDSEGLR